MEFSKEKIASLYDAGNEDARATESKATALEFVYDF